MKTHIVILAGCVTFCGVLQLHAYRDPETGTFLTRDPKGFVDGPNMYTYVNQNPWTLFDPEGLEIKFFTTQKTSEGYDVRVPYTPTPEQQKRLNTAIKDLREKGGDLGKAMANALESKGKNKITFEVTHGKGDSASAFPATVVDGKPRNPQLGLDLDSKNLSTYSPDITLTPEQQKQQKALYDKEVSKNPAVVLGHETGHTIKKSPGDDGQTGIRDPENVSAVENPLRESMGEKPRETYRDKPVPAPSSSAKQAVEDFKKEWKSPTNTAPVPEEKKK